MSALFGGVCVFCADDRLGRKKTLRFVYFGSAGDYDIPGTAAGNPVYKAKQALSTTGCSCADLTLS